MHIVSSDFRDAVVGSHQMATQVDLWYGGSVIATNIDVIRGQVTADESNAIRGRLTIEVADQTGALFPRGAPGLGVYGHELHVRSGIVLPSGIVELVSAGWYRVQTVTVTEGYTRTGESTGITLTIDALDRMASINDYRFMAPEQPAGGSTCLGEIRRLARGMMTYAPWTVADLSVPASLTYADSRIDAINALAAHLNAYAYADENGDLAVTSRVNASEPVWEYGPTDITETSYDLSRDAVYNAVVARGETLAERAPIQATALDMSPDSPIRWDSPYGRVPYFYSSPILNTQAAVEEAATTRLVNLIEDRDRLVSIQVVPNPALELGDNIRVTTPRASVVGRLTSYSMPLGPEAATLGIRVRESEFS